MNSPLSIPDTNPTIYVFLPLLFPFPTPAVILKECSKSQPDISLPAD